MNEPGQHYEPMQDDDGIFMNQCEPGKGYVRAADYTRLEQECAHLREERDSFQRVGIRTMEERDAALKQMEGLQADAARYRWIFTVHSSEAAFILADDKAHVDAEIDLILQAGPCVPTK